MNAGLGAQTLGALWAAAGWKPVRSDASQRSLPGPPPSQAPGAHAHQLIQVPQNHRLHGNSRDEGTCRDKGRGAVSPQGQQAPRPLLTPASHAAPCQASPLGRTRSVPRRVPAHPCWRETLKRKFQPAAPPAGSRRSVSGLKCTLVGPPGGTGGVGEGSPPLSQGENN